MARSNDIADKVLNIGIVAGVVIGLVFLYKFFKNQFGGGGGPGGPANKPSAGNPAGGSMFDRLDAAYHKDILEPGKETRIAYELEAANIAALQYWNKPGSNIVINKVLKAVNKLNDVDFMAAVTKWLSLTKEKDFYKTTLVGAKIYTAGHSDFLVRYERLSGNPATSGMDVNTAISNGLHLAGNLTGTKL
jgi:hypothetical protein